MKKFNNFQIIKNNNKKKRLIKIYIKKSYLNMKKNFFFDIHLKFNLLYNFLFKYSGTFLIFLIVLNKLKIDFL